MSDGLVRSQLISGSTVCSKMINPSSAGQGLNSNKTNSFNLYTPMKGYFREIRKSQNINPIYLNHKFNFGIIQIIRNACQVCFSA